MPFPVASKASRQIWVVCRDMALTKAVEAFTLEIYRDRRPQHWWQRTASGQMPILTPGDDLPLSWCRGWGLVERGLRLCMPPQRCLLMAACAVSIRHKPTLHGWRSVPRRLKHVALQQRLSFTMTTPARCLEPKPGAGATIRRHGARTFSYRGCRALVADHINKRGCQRGTRRLTRPSLRGGWAEEQPLRELFCNNTMVKGWREGRGLREEGVATAGGGEGGGRGGRRRGRHLCSLAAYWFICA
jgi:hypothetical protein